MATKKTFQIENNYPLDFSINNEIHCDNCDSDNIIETREGYSCRACGIVLEIQKFEYNRPYKENQIQHAILGITQMGSIRERLQYQNSVRLEKLNKLHNILNNKGAVFNKARIEISRILNYLNLPESPKRAIFDKFKNFYAALKPGTKYRNPEKLVPLTIYFYLKFQNISIKEAELLEISKISKKDFNAFKLQIQNFFPQYKERNRKEYITQRILEITEHFHLGMDFFYQSKSVMNTLWEGIKNTKDDVIAGLSCSLIALCHYKEKIAVNAICNKLGIKMSTIQTQVKKRIFERFRVSGFVSLVKSSNLLKQIMNKLELIEIKEKSNNIEAPNDIIEIVLGNGVQISNNSNNLDFYFYVIRDDKRLPLIVSLQLFNHREDNNKYSKLHNMELERDYVKLEILRFYTGIGPPIINHG